VGDVLEGAGYTFPDKNGIWEQKARGLRLFDLVLSFTQEKSINAVTVDSDIATGKTQLCELRKEKVSISLRAV